MVSGSPPLLGPRAGEIAVKSSCASQTSVCGLQNSSTEHRAGLGYLGTWMQLSGLSRRFSRQRASQLRRGRFRPGNLRVESYRLCSFGTSRHRMMSRCCSVKSCMGMELLGVLSGAWQSMEQK